ARNCWFSLEWFHAAVPTPFVAKLRKPTVGLSANHHPMCRVGPAARESSSKFLRVECRIGEARSGEIEVSVEKLRLTMCLIRSVRGWGNNWELSLPPGTAERA